MVVATAVFMALASGFFGWSNERQAQFTCEGGTHVAQPYDTLWQIASDRCTGNMQNAVYHFAELNGGSAIQIGQKVLIPTGPSEGSQHPANRIGKCGSIEPAVLMLIPNYSFKDEELVEAPPWLTAIDAQ